MKVTTTAQGEFRLRAHISLDAGELRGFIARAQEELSGGVAVPGFRKGKAPKHLAEESIPAGAVKEAALELALSGSFADAVRQQGWDILKTSGLSVVRNEDTELAYDVDVDLWPPVTLADLATVRVTRRSVSVGEQEIDQSLDAVRTMRSTFLDKTAPAQDGDRVELDFDASIGGTQIPGGTARNYPLILGGKTFMPGFEEQVLGLTPGMAKQFTLTAPAGYADATLAGKTIDFSVTVRRVQAVLKPVADDAFAQSLGKFASLAALRGSIRDHLTAEKQAKEHERTQLAILDAVIAGSSVPAPSALVDEELDAMIQRFAEDIAERGLELPLYLARLNKTQESLRADWKPEAQRQVRIMLVLREIAKQQRITAGDEELEALTAQVVQAMTRSGQPQESLDPDRLRLSLTQRLIRDKTLDYLERTCATEA
jgi:trigger factor